MLTHKHLEKTRVYSYTIESDLDKISSDETIQILNHDSTESINFIAIYKTLSNKRGIIINIHKICNNDYHIYTTFKFGKCSKDIYIPFPNIKLLKLIFDYGNEEIKDIIHRYIKTAGYFSINNMDFKEATWLMSTVLGSVT